MLRYFLVLLLLLSVRCVLAQQHSIGLGIYTGISAPFSMDGGIDQDPRYKALYRVKAIPAGLTFSIDYEGFGFVLSPGLYNIGQHYTVVNWLGGHDGTREINLNYVNVPLALKIHLIDLSFFRVSALASVSAAYLYKAEDRITHTYSKLRFPLQAQPLLSQEFYTNLGYEIQYDGVIVPEVQNLLISETRDYNKIQLFAGAGLRSDWDVSNSWRVSFDVRVNYGLLEPRSALYTGRIESYESIYDFPGRRNELFAQLTFGVSRFLDYDKSDKDRAKKLKGKNYHKPSIKTAPPKRRSPRN